MRNKLGEALIAIVFASCAACSAFKPGTQPEPETQAQINALCTIAGDVGCGFIPASKRPAVADALATALPIVQTDPVAAMTALQGLAQSIGLPAAVGDAFGLVAGYAGSAGGQYAEGAVGALIVACQSAIGATDPKTAHVPAPGDEQKLKSLTTYQLAHPNGPGI